LGASLQRLEFRHAAVIAQHIHEHVFGHAGGERGIDHAHDGHALRQIGIAQQLLDAAPREKMALRRG
jgi:hypothetical protein